jgi:hypothetical protein
MDALAIGFGFHPVARFVFFHFVTGVISVLTLLIVANARRQSLWAALWGVPGLLGLLFGLLFLIAMPSRAGQAPD